MLICVGCEWHLRPTEKNGEETLNVQRYDRMEALYLTTGDLAALHQMNTDYPEETRTLIEDLLHLGHINDSGINTRFLHFFQDTTLQTLIAAVDSQYADMSDIDKQLTDAFRHMHEFFPNIGQPRVYAQISSLDQSIIVGHGMLGISLDKYLGKDYPVYLRYGFTERQRTSMTRSYIVPDCLVFYLLSKYPLSLQNDTIAEARDRHMGRIQYVANTCLGYRHFKTAHVEQTEAYMREHPHTSLHLLLNEE